MAQQILFKASHSQNWTYAGLKHLIIELQGQDVLVRSATDDAQGTEFRLVIPLFLLPDVVKGLTEAYEKNVDNVANTKVQVRL